MKTLRLFPLLISIGFNLGLYAQTSDAEIDNYSQVCRLSNKKLYKTTSIDIVIYNRRGEKNTQFEVYYSGNQKILKLNGRITDMTGKTIRKLNKDDIVTSSAIADFSFYEDDIVKHFTLRHNEYPYKIHVDYEIEYIDFLNLANWSPVYDPLYKTLSAGLEIRVPENYPIRINQKLVDNPEIQKTDGETIYRWKSTYTKLVPEESYAPPFETLIPMVTVVLETFVYDLPGSFKTWESYGSWQYDMIKGQQLMPESEKQKLDNLLAKSTTTKEKIFVLYHYLQDNTRYINITLGTGGLKPHPASYVAYNKYGDCKALSNYLITMLKYAGIDSYYAKIYADEDNPPLEPGFPSQQFNHVIVCVPVENDTIWLECTDKYNPAGYVGTSIQDRYALIIDEEMSHLTKTPELKSEDVQSFATFNIKPSIGGTDLVTYQLCLHGRNYEAYNYLFKELSKPKQEEVIRKTVPFSNFDIKSWSVKPVHRDSAAIIATITLETSHLIKKYGNDLVFNPISSKMPEFENPQKRTLPVWIPYPVAFSDSVILEIPFGKTATILNEEVNLETAYGSYSISSTMENYKVVFIRNFTLNKGNYALEEYRSFYAFIQNVRSYESKNLVTLK